MPNAIIDQVPRAYDAAVEAHAYDCLYGTCVETDPSTPAGYEIPLLDLEQRSVDPTTPYGEIFPRAVVAQGCKDAWNRLFDSLNPLDSWSRKMVLRRYRPEQPLKDDMNRRMIEIIRDMLCAWKQGVDREKMGDEELQIFDAWWRSKH